ncbi:serine/threonine protein kinase, CMGC [Thecaphora frezii]
MFDKWAFGMSKIDKPIGSNSKGFKSSASSEAAGSKVSSLAISKDGEKVTESIGHSILQLSTQGGMTSSSSSSEPFGSKTTTVAPQQKGPLLPLQQVLLITVKIVDLGNTCWKDHHFTSDIQTRQYRCPEVILGAKWGPSTNMWSASCMFFELLMGNYLFDLAAGTKYNKYNNHITQIIELLGNFPKSLAFAGKYSTNIFNHHEELQHIHKLRFWPLISVLWEKYLMLYNKANTLSSFLLPMLRLHPEKQASAPELLMQPYLKGIVMQGKIELAMKQAGIDIDALQAGSDDCLHPMGCLNPLPPI